MLSVIQKFKRVVTSGEDGFGDDTQLVATMVPVMHNASIRNVFWGVVANPDG